MKFTRIILFLISCVTIHFLIFGNAFCQDTNSTPDLIPIYKVEGSYIDSIEHNLIIPKYNLKSDIGNKLYYEENLIFEPNGNFTHCYYEIFKEQYIIITPIYNTLISIRLPIKNLVRVISFTDVNKIYESDLQSCILKDIDINRLIVHVENFDYEIVEVYMKELE